MVDWGKVDNDQVGVHGTSYGGYLLLAFDQHQTDRFAASDQWFLEKVNIISFSWDSPK